MVIRNRSSIDYPNYESSVLTARECSADLTKSIGVKEQKLKQTYRWMPYAKDCSLNVMNSDSENYPKWYIEKHR